jgi:hypothetical protein
MNGSHPGSTRKIMQRSDLSEFDCSVRGQTCVGSQHLSTPPAATVLAASSSKHLVYRPTSRASSAGHVAAGSSGSVLVTSGAGSSCSQPRSGRHSPNLLPASHAQQVAHFNESATSSRSNYVPSQHGGRDIPSNDHGYTGRLILSC